MATQITAPHETESIQREVNSLKDRVESIIVRNQEDFIAVATLETQGKDFIKRWENVYAEPLRLAKANLDGVRNELNQRVSLAKQIVELARKKGDDWKEEERAAGERERQREQQRLQAEQREKAQAEQREAERVAEENRKAREAELEEQRKAGEIGKREEARLKKQAEEDEAKAKELAQKQAAKTAADVKEVKVKPNIPTVAGKKNQVYYSAQISDPGKFFRAYDKAVIDKDEVRAAFLRGFLMIDQGAVGKHARDTKNNAQTEREIPGSTASSKG